MRVRFITRWACAFPFLREILRVSPSHIEERSLSVPKRHLDSEHASASSEREQKVRLGIEPRLQERSVCNGLLMRQNPVY